MNSTTHRTPPITFRDIALVKLNDVELADVRDRLLLAALCGRCPRPTYAEHLAGIEARLERSR